MTSIHRLVLAAAIGTGWILSTGTLAADVPPTALERVEVTASRDVSGRRDLSSFSVSTEFNSSEDLRSSLSELLRSTSIALLPQLPGAAQHPTASFASMRGSPGPRALVVLNGYPINDPFFGTADIDLVPAIAIGAVSVIASATSGLYGSAATNGLIALQTKVAETVASVGVGTLDQFQLNVANTWRTDSSRSMSAFVAGSRSQQYVKLVPEMRGPLDTESGSSRGQAIVEWQTGLDQGEDFNGLLLLSKTGTDLGSPLSTAESSRVLAGATYATRSASQPWSVSLWADGASLDSDNPRTPFGGVRGFDEYLENRLKSTGRRLGGSISVSPRLASAWGSVRYGVDVTKTSGTSESKRFSQSGVTLLVETSGGTQTNGAAFLAAQFPLSTWIVDASARLDRVKNSSNDGATSSFTKPSGKVGVSHKICDGLAYIAVSNGFRSPTLDNLYRSGSAPGGIFLANSALRPELVKSIDIGFEKSWDDFSLKVGAYRSVIRDLLGSRSLNQSELPPGTFFGTKQENIARVVTEGVDSSFSARLGSATFVATFSLATSQIAENESDPASLGMQLASVPRYRGFVLISSPITSQAELSASFRSSSSFTADNRGSLPVGSADIVSISVLQRFELVQWRLVVENALNRRYVAANSGFSPAALNAPRSLRIEVVVPIR